MKQSLALPALDAAPASPHVIPEQSCAYGATATNGRRDANAGLGYFVISPAIPVRAHAELDRPDRSARWLWNNRPSLRFEMVDVEISQEPILVMLHELAGYDNERAYR
ncbi:hypothetical protein AB6803_26470 [Rhizobium sp. RCC_161_2]